LKGKMYGDGSTGRIAIAWKPVFQANFQIRRLIFENFQIFFLVKKYLIFRLG
jgi:hypothetical protein